MHPCRLRKRTARDPHSAKHLSWLLEDNFWSASLWRNASVVEGELNSCDRHNGEASWYSGSDLMSWRVIPQVQQPAPQHRYLCCRTAWPRVMLKYQLPREPFGQASDQAFQGHRCSQPLAPGRRAEKPKAFRRNASSLLLLP